MYHVSKLQLFLKELDFKMNLLKRNLGRFFSPTIYDCEKLFFFLNIENYVCWIARFLKHFFFSLTWDGGQRLRKNNYKIF